MSSLIDRLGIDRLSHAERLQLLEELLGSIDADREARPLTEAQRQELDHRLTVLEADPTAVRSWEEVQSRILARLS
jgi:putative addiction module component (TIGR02574 family)